LSGAASTGVESASRDAFLFVLRRKNPATSSKAVPTSGVTEVVSMNACAQRSINSPSDWAAVVLRADPVEESDESASQGSVRNVDDGCDNQIQRSRVVKGRKKKTKGAKPRGRRDP